MRRILSTSMFIVVLVACGGPRDDSDAGPGTGLDAAIDAPPIDGSPSDTGTPSDALVERCGQGANPYSRYCACEDAGGRFVVACAISEGKCFAYSSECTDEGFVICEATATGELRMLCEAFCDAHRMEDWAGGCGTLVDAG